MPITIPAAPDDNASPAETGTDPVQDITDVQNTWSTDVTASETHPIIDAIQSGQAGLCLRYQDASGYAAAQSDILRATSEYLDEIIGYERGIPRAVNESDVSYRTRGLSFTKTVDPDDIVAAANAVLAPYTAISARYFEHLDAWHLRNDYLDIVGATNASPIQITTRFPLPDYVTTGSVVTITNVSGNTSANATWTVTVTGSRTLTLDTSTGSGTYAGGGSLLAHADDPSVNATQWSSHVFGDPSTTPNYPDRLYSAITNRRPLGARAFSSAHGRMFWLLVPEISGIDANVSAVYSYASNIDRLMAGTGSGLFVASAFTLPGQLVVTHASTGTLDATHTVGLADSSTGTTTVKLIAAPSANQQLAVFDTGNDASMSPITVDGNGHNVEDPEQLGVYAATITIRTNKGSGLWIWNSGSSQWDIYGLAGSYVWSIGATSYQVYNAIVGAVEAIRGQSIRWVLWADPKLVS